MGHDTTDGHAMLGAHTTDDRTPLGRKYLDRPFTELQVAGPPIDGESGDTKQRGTSLRGRQRWEDTDLQRVPPPSSSSRRYPPSQLFPDVPVPKEAKWDAPLRGQRVSDTDAVRLLAVLTHDMEQQLADWSAEDRDRERQRQHERFLHHLRGDDQRGARGR